MKSKLGLSLLLILVFTIICTGSVFASSVDVIGYLDEDESSSETSSSSSTTISDITSISSISSSSSSSSSSTDTNTNKTKLPQTGENDTMIFVSIVVFAGVAIYAYKKVNDYKF